MASARSITRACCLFWSLSVTLKRTKRGSRFRKCNGFGRQSGRQNGMLRAYNERRGLSELRLSPVFASSVLSRINSKEFSMANYHSDVDGTVWLDVRRETPCPCCGAVHGCGIITSGEFARCMKIVSQWPIVAGGWLHSLEVRATLQVEELPVSA